MWECRDITYVWKSQFARFGFLLLSWVSWVLSQVSGLGSIPAPSQFLYVSLCSCLFLLLSKVMPFSREEELPMSSVLCHVAMAETQQSGMSSAFSPV